MTELVQVEERENYTLIQMDDGKANALGFDMFEQLNAALDAAEVAGKVVVIAGRPGKFSAGFDLSVMAGGGEQMIDLLNTGFNVSLRLLEFPTPVVLAVSGHALAMGGLTLLSADYRIGCEGPFKIGLNEVAIGMTMPWFGVELARGRLAPAHYELAVNCANIYEPAAAIAAGFLDEVVAGEDLLARADAIAGQLSGLDMNAHRGTKARVREELLTALRETFSKELNV